MLAKGFGLVDVRHRNRTTIVPPIAVDGCVWVDAIQVEAANFIAQFSIKVCIMINDSDSFHIAIRL